MSLPENLDAILFDLDGTLIDSLAEIVDVANDVLAHEHMPLASRTEVEQWIGNGTPHLMRAVLRHGGLSEVEIEQDYDYYWSMFRSHYMQRSGTNSPAYPGMEPCIRALYEQGYKLGVVTNKVFDSAEQILNDKGYRKYFSIVIGGDTLSVRKPDPKPLLTAIESLGGVPEQSLYIGDSMVDWQTGRAAGVTTWLFRHGYHHGHFDVPERLAEQPDRFLNDFDELRAILVT